MKQAGQAGDVKDKKKSKKKDKSTKKKLAEALVSIGSTYSSAETDPSGWLTRQTLLLMCWFCAYCRQKSRTLKSSWHAKRHGTRGQCSTAEQMVQRHACYDRALLFAVAFAWACVWQTSVYLYCSNMTGLWSMHCTNRYHDALEEAGLICGVCLEGT